MKADQFYDIKIEYFNALAEAELRLLWKLPHDEESSWLENWWYGDDPMIVPAQYFVPPLEKVDEVIQEPKVEPIAKPKPPSKPKPKSKLKSKPKPPTVKPAPVVVLKKKKVIIDTLQQYIPNSVEFERTKSEILPSSFPELNKLADFLVKHPTRIVRIEGHTDSVGDITKNFRLSEKRAYAVAAYLVKKGVRPNQLIAKGFGGTKPLVRSTTKKYNPENRRVAFIIE